MTWPPSRLAQRRVEQVGGAVVGADLGAALGVDREMDGVADRDRALADHRMVGVELAERLRRVLNVGLQALVAS